MSSTRIKPLATYGRFDGDGRSKVELPCCGFMITRGKARRIINCVVSLGLPTYSNSGLTAEILFLYANDVNVQLSVVKHSIHPYANTTVQLEK
jgi:hypothetical protein